MRFWTPFLILTAVVLLLASHGFAAESGAPAFKYVPGRLIIKFKDTVQANLDEILATDKSLQSVISPSDGKTNLEHLRRKYKFKEAHAIFRDPKAVHMVRRKYGYTNVSGLKDADAAQYAQIRARFAKRTHRISQESKIPNLQNIYVVSVDPNADINRLVSECQKDPIVEYCQPDYQHEAHFQPNDQFFGQQWGLKKIQADQVWDLTKGEGVVVAVVDSGVDYNHPDLVHNIWHNPKETVNNGVDDDNNGYVDDVIGWNFVQNNNDPMDEYGHGTHVAGIIAAEGNNNLGIIGVAPKAKIMPVKVIDKDGYASDSNLMAGLIYAAKNGADVINNSWGKCGTSCPPNPLFDDALTYAYNLGSVLVFSAGNQDQNVVDYSPTNAWQIIRVAATDQNDQKTNFSNYGELIDVSAPGQDILSLDARQGNNTIAHLFPATSDQNYMTASGTSMAAPHVAGTIALMLSLKPYLTIEEVRQILHTSADDIGAYGFDPETGYGRVNANKAVHVNYVIDTKINEPKPGTLISPEAKTLNITGTVLRDGLNYYQLFIKKDEAGSDWVPLTDPVYTTFQNSLIASINLDKYDVGSYLLRLIAVAKDGYVFEDHSSFRLDNMRPITTFTTVNQLYPKTAGRNVVWSNDAQELYLYNLDNKTTLKLTDRLTNFHFAISNDHVVWEGQDGLNVYELSNQNHIVMPLRSTITSNLSIAGNNVVYTGSSFEGSGLMIYDLNQQKERLAIKPTSRFETPFNITADGDYVAFNRATNFFDVFLYQISTNTLKQISQGDPANPWNWFEAPAISGNKVVWQWDNNGIMMHTIDAGQTQMVIPLKQSSAAPSVPDIDGDNIVYVDNTSDVNKVYLYNLGNETRTFLTSQYHEYKTNPPQISQGCVAIASKGSAVQNISIYAISRPPQIQVNSQLQTVLEGDHYSVSVVAQDPTQTQVQLSAQLGNGDPIAAIGASFVDQGNGQGIFEWTPSMGYGGKSFLVNFKAVNAQGQDASKAIWINVQSNPSNNALKLNRFQIGPSNIRVGQAPRIAFEIQNMSDAPIENPQIAISSTLRGSNESHQTGFFGPTIAPHSTWQGEIDLPFSFEHNGWHTIHAKVGGDQNTIEGSTQDWMFYVATGNGAKIQGTLRDAQGNPLEGRIVQLSSGSWGMTQNNGSFEINNIPPGQYVMSVRDDADVPPFAFTVVQPDSVATIYIQKGHRTQSVTVDSGALPNPRPVVTVSARPTVLFTSK